MGRPLSGEMLTLDREELVECIRLAVRVRAARPALHALVEDCAKPSGRQRAGLVNGEPAGGRLSERSWLLAVRLPGAPLWKVHAASLLADGSKGWPQPLRVQVMVAVDILMRERRETEV